MAYPQDLDEDRRRQALRQTLSDTLTLDSLSAFQDHARNFLSPFASNSFLGQNNHAAEGYPAPHPFFSSYTQLQAHQAHQHQHQAPSFPLARSGLAPPPLSIPRPAFSLAGFSLLAGQHAQAQAQALTHDNGKSYLSASQMSAASAWRDSDDFMMAVVGSERQRLAHLRTALIGKQQQRLATVTSNEAQTTKQALLALLQQDQQQQQQQQHEGSYLSRLQSMQAAVPHAVASLAAPTSSTTTSTTPVYTDGSNFYQPDNPQPTDSTKVFKALGSSLRGKTDLYIDISSLPVVASQEHQTIRGGVAEPFPEKLYFMLQQVEQEGKSDIISFYPHGRAFCIHDMKKFADEILPKYFSKQGKLVSFVRQINLYGFARIHSGQDAGGYYHELFLKGRPELFTYMRRAGASKGKDDRRKRKDRHLPAIQPDFYAMKPICPAQPKPNQTTPAL
jgi:hypothetical protein